MCTTGGLGYQWHADVVNLFKSNVISFGSKMVGKWPIIPDQGIDQGPISRLCP